MGNARDKGKDVTAGHRPHRTLLPDTVGLDHQQPPALQGRANTARANTQHRVRARYRCLDAALLYTCWQDVHKDAARGVDHGTAEASAATVHAKIAALAQRRKTKRSRATLVRRWDLPTENGKESP